MHNKPNESPELREKAHAVRFATSLYRKIGDHALTDVAAGASPKNLSPLARKLHKRRSKEENDDDDDGRPAASPLSSSSSPGAPTKRPSLIAGASTFAAVPGYDPPTVRQHRTTSWPASFVTRSGKLAALDASTSCRAAPRQPRRAAAAGRRRRRRIDEEHTAAPAAARLPRPPAPLPTSAPAAACGPRSPRAPPALDFDSYRSRLAAAAARLRDPSYSPRDPRRHARVLPGARAVHRRRRRRREPGRSGRRVQADGRRADGGVLVLPAPLRTRPSPRGSTGSRVLLRLQRRCDVAAAGREGGRKDARRSRRWRRRPTATATACPSAPPSCGSG